MVTFAKEVFLMSDLKRQLGQQMLIFHRLYNEKVSRRIRAIHVEAISQSEFLLLAIVLENGGVPMAELVTRSNMKKQQVSRMVNQLEEKGLLTRKRCEANRRTLLLAPTEAALTLQKQVTEEIESELASVFGQLDASISEEYLKAIQTINDILARFPSGSN